MTEARIIAFPSRRGETSGSIPEALVTNQAPATSDESFEDWYDTEAVDFAGKVEDLMLSVDAATFWERAALVRSQINGWPIP